MTKSPTYPESCTQAMDRLALDRPLGVHVDIRAGVDLAGILRAIGMGFTLQTMPSPRKWPLPTRIHIDRLRDLTGWQAAATAALARKSWRPSRAKTLSRIAESTPKS